ncbi:MAG: hypothetical protein E7I42_26285, partial [Pluralibacter gergoviae]|nr:hypothetical protein [Pluralibacter gergoviae]
DYRTKAGYYDRLTRAQNKPAMVTLPGKITNTVNIAINFFTQDNRPIAGAPYQITFEGGQVLQGALDEKGHAEHKNVPDESAKVIYTLPEPLPDAPWPPYSDLIQRMNASFTGSQDNTHG